MSDKTYEDFFSDEKKAEIQEYIRRLADYKAKRISFENYRKPEYLYSGFFLIELCDAKCRLHYCWWRAAGRRSRR